MFERIVFAAVIFAGGDFGGGLNANIAVMPSFIKACGAVGVDIDRFGHGAAGPFIDKAVDKAKFIGVFV